MNAAPMPDPVTMSCVLCGKPATRVTAGDREHYLWHCPCCGGFDLSDACCVMLDKLPTQIRKALCTASIASDQIGRPLRITLQHVSHLAKKRA